MRNHLFTLGTLLLFALGACKTDPCKDVTCFNEGICLSGVCDCAAGYDGPTCDNEQRLAFVGNYQVQENCNMGSFNYQLTITAPSQTATEVVVHNLGDFDFDVTATISGSSIALSDTSENGYTVTGTGTLANETLSLNYTITTTGQQELICSLSGQLQP